MSSFRATFSRRRSILMIAAFSLIIVAGLQASAASLSQTPARLLMQQAQHEEIANGKPATAIALYERAVQAAGKDRALAADALLGMANCYEKLADPRAKVVRERIVRDYADQPDAVRAARSSLGLANSGPQGLFGERILDQQFTGRALSNFPSVAASPDGKFLIMGKQTGSDTRREFFLVMRDLATGSEQTIASLGSTGPSSVRLSPDGRWVAVRYLNVPYAEVEPGSRVYRDELLILEAKPNATKPASITWLFGTDYFSRVNAGWLTLQWSPDSRSLPHLVPAATPGRYEVRLFNVVSRQSQPLGIELDGLPEFQWSPNGAELAVHATNRDASKDEIVVVDVASGRRRGVAVPNSTELRTVLSGWTARGDFVLRQFKSRVTGAVARTGDADGPVDLRLLPATGATARTVCSSPQSWNSPVPRIEPQKATDDECLDVTRDGSTVVFWKHQSQRVMLRDTATLADRPLTMGSGIEQFPKISPDGRIVVLNSNRSGKWAWYVALVGTSPDPNPVLLSATGTLPDDLELYWTRDSVVAKWSEWSSELHRINVNPKTGRSTGALERLTQETGPAYSPAISPDSKRIAYWAAFMGQLGVATMDADGANERVITPEPMQPFGFPYWSGPDQIVFGEFLRPRTGVWTAPKEPMRRWRSLDLPTRAVTGVPAPELESLLSLEAFRAITFLQPTRELVYDVVNQVDGRTGGFNPATTRDVHTLHARSVVDGRDRVLATIDAPSTSAMGLLASPDGRRIAYLLGVDTAKGRHAVELGIVSVSDSARKILFRGGMGEAFINNPMAWSPDGRFLLYSRYAEPRVTDVETLESWPLVEDAHHPAQNSDLMRALRQWGPTGEANWSPDGSFIVLTMSSYPNFARQWTGITAEALSKLRR